MPLDWAPIITIVTRSAATNESCLIDDEDRQRHLKLRTGYGQNGLSKTK